ncbi:MAG: tRNA threonylcarbamoyladenosine dehydratase [Clostridia bacterium]|nr:tRNA threonylcarbamoyladenosine dehydratase [Clostridia bacterium]
MGIFDRSEALLGADALNTLKSSHIAVFGVGGVGSYTVEALVRGGIGRLSVFDGDTVSETNINRQLVATTKTIGEDKVAVAKQHATEVNPDIQVTAEKIFFSAENADSIDFSQFDYVVDAIDTVSSKLLLIEKSKTAGVPVISCMGAGNKLDPTRFEVTDISKTSVCPLAKIMRYELKKRGISKVKVVYSKEEPIKHGLSENGRPLPGSVSFVPSAAGLIIAGEVIKDLIK